MDRESEPEIVFGTELKDSKKITICALCNEANLIKHTYLAKCEGPDCGDIYCIHYASSLDPHMCLYCLSDVTCTEESGRSIHTTRDDDTGVEHHYTRRYKSIKFTGMDWLFQQRKIAQMTDTEIGVAVEYHRAIMQGLILERDERKIKHFHRNSGKGHSTLDILGIPGTVSNTKTTTKVKKTRTTTQKSPEDVAKQAAEIMAKLKAAGMDLNTLLKAVK